MQQLRTCRVEPELKKVVTEATQSLARLDADRLEELAHSCEALNREPVDSEELAALTGQAHEAVNDMAVFAKVLEATRDNLSVMTRLREFRSGRMGYGKKQEREWRRAGRYDGNN